MLDIGDFGTHLRSITSNILYHFKLTGTTALSGTILVAVTF